MALKDIMNRGVCGVADQKGFNTNKGCAVPFSEITAIWVTPYGFSFSDFTEESVKDAQKNSGLNILKDIQAFTPQNTEAQVSTTAKGFKSKSIAGIYEFKAVWNEDIWFNSLLGALEGKKSKKVFLQSKDTIYGTEDKNGNFSGFSVYSIIRDLQTFQEGTESAMQALNIQFEDEDELNDQAILVSSDNLDFSINDVEPIVQSYAYFHAVPTTTDTSIAVKVVFDKGRKGEVAGLTNPKGFTVYIGDVKESATGIEALDNDGNIYYNIAIGTSLTLDTVVKVSLAGVQEVEGDCLYVSNTSSAVVISGS